MTERHKLLLESPELQDEKIPRRSSKSSSSDYVLHITSLLSQYAASTSSPSNDIDIFDKVSLQGIQTLPGHEVAITSLHSVDNLAGVMRKCLVSSGKDGSVKAWDERSNSHSIKMTNLGRSRGILCYDVSSDGLTVAAGTELQGDDALILYWDPRQPATPLRTHGSTHSDDITTVSFAPEKNRATGQNILLSGSTDGLLSTSNASEDDEDEATIQVGNWGCSLSQAGWIQGPLTSSSSAGIWAASDMETFSTWTSELDQLMSLDIRSPVLHHGRTWVTDYLITAQNSQMGTPNLSVFTGSNQGDVALLSNMNTSVPDAPWCLHKLWSHGHVGVVRGLFWDEPSQILVTGGEDAKINMWPIYPIAPELNSVKSEEAIEDNDDEEGGQRRSDDMDIEISSPKARKRERERAAEREAKRARRDLS